MHDVAAEGTSVAGIELQSRALSMAFIAPQVRSAISVLGQQHWPETSRPGTHAYGVWYKFWERCMHSFMCALGRSETTAWYALQVVAIGCENGSLLLLDARSGAVEHVSERAHTARIRGVAAVPSPHASEAASTYVGSASSDGAVKLWDLRSASKLRASRAIHHRSPALLLFVIDWSVTRLLEEKTLQGVAGSALPESCCAQVLLVTCKVDRIVWRHRRRQLERGARV